VTNKDCEAIPVKIVGVVPPTAMTPNSAVLTPEDKTILTVLSKAGHALIFTSIETAAAALVFEMGRDAAHKAGLVNLNEKLVRARVSILVNQGLVSKPMGPDDKTIARKGVGITDAGRARLTNKP
jgi:hypothetical protein